MWLAGGFLTPAAALLICSRRCAAGAIVTGFDKSAGMVELARRRLGGDAGLQVASWAARFPSPADADLSPVPEPPAGPPQGRSSSA